MLVDADADADAVTPSSNTRSYTLRSVPASLGRSFLRFVYTDASMKFIPNIIFHFLCLVKIAQPLLSTTPAIALLEKCDFEKQGNMVYIVREIHVTTILFKFHPFDISQPLNTS